MRCSRLPTPIRDTPRRTTDLPSPRARYSGIQRACRVRGTARAGGRLVNFVNDQCVGGTDVVVLKPSARDARGDDDDIPRRSVRRSLALSIDDPDTKRFRLENRLGDGPDPERLSSSSARDDSESCTAFCEPLDLVPMLTLEHRIEMQPEREFDRLARRTSWRDNDDSSLRKISGEAVAIWREVAVLDRAWSRH